MYKIKKNNHASLCLLIYIKLIFVLIKIKNLDSLIKIDIL